MKYTIYPAFLLFFFPVVSAGQFLFNESTASSGIFMRSAGAADAGAGVVVFDFDGDGWDDIYLPGGYDTDKLFLNMHDGTFKNVAPLNLALHGITGRSYPRGGIAFDYDNDGKTDLYVVCQNRDILWHNNGDGTFTDVTRQAQLNFPLDQNESMGATFGDFNGDGFNDFYVARWIHVYEWPYIGWPNWLYVNNRNGTFTDKAKELGVDGDTGITNIALFFDYDRDGDLDLLIGNDWKLKPNQVWKNMLMETGEATFVNVSKEINMDLTLSCMGITPCDYNRDGQFDFFETTQGPDYLMKNNGDCVFDSVSKTLLPSGEGLERSGTGLRTTSWTTLMQDYDNDGWEDGFIVHGYLTETRDQVINPHYADTSIFLHNTGSIFEDYTDHALNGKYIDFKGRGAAYLDFNHDGKIDICVGAMENDSYSPLSDFRLLQNITPNNVQNRNWLEMNFTAKRTAKEGIGTIVDVWAGGIVHSRQVSTGGGFGSQNSLVQHVGLGEFQVADSINVFWPADKYRHRQIDHYYNVPADIIYHITENMTSQPQPNLLESVNSRVSEQSSALYPNPALNVLNIKNLQPSVFSRLEIFDVLGVKQVEMTGSESTFSLSVANLKPGCYSLRITREGNSFIKQFIKE